MAEESSANELEGLEKQLHSLLSRYPGDEFPADSEPFCSDFCKLVEEYTSRWQVPLPQLRILETALCCFVRASTLFASNCDHVHHTISSLALSVFELLLFFDQKDFYQEPLKEFTATFQECHLVLAKYQNVHLLQVERLVQGGGPWASPTLQAILSKSNLPQNEVDGYVSSELPAFFELRVRYLLSCERVSEAVALAICCVRHPIAGQNLFFLQVYLSWLYRTSQHEQLRKEVADVNGKDAVHIICSLEREEKDELLLALSTAFLSEQLHRGDVYYLCELVLVWTNLHRRLSTSKQALLKECHQLMLSTANVKSIFPFIRAILQEVGEEAIQFCVELCANALQSCVPCDVITKSLIYKTIAGLLPNDLEVCRACALLVFFLERTVESYKMVYLLYMHPDQEYHVDDSPIGNNVRFETLQVLKKDLYFDPEFWNLIALRTNCLKLMSEKVVSAALEEIMEDKWISKYWSKEPALRSSRSACRRGLNAAAKKRHQKEDIDSASKRLKMGKTRLNDHAVRKKGNQALKDTSSGPLRRSFWQLDRIHSNVALRYEEHRRTTRLSEKNPPKRRIRKPKWLLEDSGTLEENVPVKMKKNGLKQAKHLRSCVMKRSETGPIKNNAKLKPLINSHLKARENDKHQNGFSEDFPVSVSPPQVILELSLPDNELMGTFAEDAWNRPRGFPQVLLYKPTVKLSDTSQSGKTVHRKEVILRARDAAMFIQQLHCYARRQKGKGNGLNVQGSVSTITRSSVQGSPPKDPQRELCEKTVSEGKGGTVSQTAAARDKVSRISEKVLKAQNVKVLSRKTSSTRDLSEKSAVEMKATSQRTGADKATKSSRIPQAKSSGKVTQSITCARDDSGNCSAELGDTTASQILAVTEVPNLQEVQPQTVALAGEPCEESAVEMKVTIASQSPVLDKVSKNSRVEDFSKAQVSQTTAAVKMKKKATGETHPVSIKANVSYSGAADSIPSHSQDVALRGGEKLKSLPSQGESGKNCNAVRNRISTMDVAEVSPKNSKGHVPCDNDTSPAQNFTQSKPSEAEASYNPTERACLNDISSLTLVTEMVTELAPERLAQDQENDKRQTSDSSASKDFRGSKKPKGPHKVRTTSSSSTSEEEASSLNFQGKTGKARAPDDNSDTPENSEVLEMTPESELEYFCTFCNKDFKGSRVVAHAMFHFRKDECMFCRMMFKDDLLAMMHLSDHIEKLKRIKEPQTGNKALEQEASDTKDTSTPKNSAKANATSRISGCRSKGRLRKSAVCSKTTSLLDLSPSESRTLRSKDRRVSGTSLHERQNPAKDPNDKTAVHRVNGHTGKKKKSADLKKDFDTKREIEQQEISQKRKKHGAMSSNLPENQDIEINSSATPVKADKEFARFKEDKKEKIESDQTLKTASKHNGNVAEEKNVEPHEKVCCPVDGCDWFTDLSKNRVALLYHALDDHRGELKPLELAFHVGNNKCSICMRVMWSFEHFQHHVERHRLAPRHPCLHQGCTARFKTGMEMRRHSRRHSPLQAMCCLPGCSQLFICLWALNLHERDHYAAKSVKPDKNTNVQTDDKPCKTPAGKNQQTSEDTTVPAAGRRTVNVKAPCQLREQATHDSQLRKNVAAPLSASTSIVKKELKDTNASKDSHVLENVSYKDTSSQRAFPNLRLRQTLRKVPVKNPTLAAPRIHKVISSSLLKHSRKVKHKLEKRQAKVNTKGLKRKGRPKLNKSVHDENTTAGQKLSSSEMVKISAASNKLKVEKEKNPQVQDEIIATNKSLVDTETKRLEGKQITRNRAHPPTSLKKPATSEVKTQKRDVVRIKKRHKIKNHHTPSDCSKSNEHKISKSKTNIKAVQKKCNKQEAGFPSAEKKPATSAVLQVEGEVAATESSDDKGKAKLDNSNSTQNDSGNSVPAIPAEDSNIPPTTENEPKVKKSKKSLIAKEGKDRHIVSSSSRKAKKANKELDKKANKRFAKEKRPCKNKGKGKISTSEKMVKSNFDVQRRDEAKGKSTVEEGRGNEEASDTKVHSSATSKPADILNCPSTTPEENKQEAHKKEKSKKSEVTNKLDASKTSKKRKDVLKTDAKKTVKKKCKDHQSSLKKSVKSTKVQRPSEKSSADTEGKTPAETPPSTTGGYSQAVNGQDPSEDVKSAASKESQVDYRKRPYMRPPPTAYLDEKFITMPKRRKELAISLPCHGGAPPPEQACGTAALQRRRCAKCFATFSSAEELQSHVQLQKCSNLFGFDSDDEGNS